MEVIPLFFCFAIDKFILVWYNVLNNVHVKYIIMIVKEIISISDARKKIFQIANDVQKANNYYTLTEKGRAKAVILSFDDFESWVETMEVLRTCPDIMEDIKELKKDIKTGAYKKYISLEEILKKEGFLEKEIKKSNAISTKIKTKSRKTTK